MPETLLLISEADQHEHTCEAHQPQFIKGSNFNLAPDNSEGEDNGKQKPSPHSKA
jgi:hypothetical protein